MSRSWTAEGFTRGATFHLVAGYMFHIGLFVLLLFAVVQCIRGKEADVPSLSEAVRMQL